MSSLLLRLSLLLLLARLHYHHHRYLPLTSPHHTTASPDPAFRFSTEESKHKTIRK
ncbi:hypothetical protein YC2023_082160 [Brassica napus]|uniref:Uncharacterized protein n=2 Tax=Brassica oleracea TaxID=3712 RepID=A0A0D3D445_BRAOL|nr:unnamed protein product [Brassica oleracea]